MRFATRTLLYSFIPFAVLLLATFFAIDKMVAAAVRHGLRSSLRTHQLSLADVQRRNELQNGRTLQVLSENASLKAGLQLVLLDPGSGVANRTLEDQLRELCEHTGFDLLLSWDSKGNPLAGVIRSGTEWVPIDNARLRIPSHGLFLDRGESYQVTSIPVNQGDENIAVLSVGERFDLSSLGFSAVLLSDSHVVKSNWAGELPSDLESSLSKCKSDAECEVRINGQSYLSLALHSEALGDKYVLRSLQSVDQAVAPVESVLREVFVVATAGALLAALILTTVSSRSIVKPIAEVVRHLQQSQMTGTLPEFDTPISETQEVRDLTESFNQAARAIRSGRNDLIHAYVECVGLLASALDARDPYTAGHSRRVSELSCAIGRKLGLESDQLEVLRTGALLHDIGKIGIPDSVLQKPGRLTPEEFALIQQHPQIGRRILEGAHGLAPFLSTVESHHENWDGTGYPHGLRGTETPLGARIVHVADAYDAMTSSRPYRNGMSPGRALGIISENRAAQFDPSLVDVLVEVLASEGIYLDRNEFESASLASLVVAVAEPEAVLEASAKVEDI